MHKTSQIKYSRYAIVKSIFEDRITLYKIGKLFRAMTNVRAITQTMSELMKSENIV